MRSDLGSGYRTAGWKLVARGRAMPEPRLAQEVEQCAVELLGVGGAEASGEGVVVVAGPWLRGATETAAIVSYYLMTGLDERLHLGFHDLPLNGQPLSKATGLPEP